MRRFNLILILALLPAVAGQLRAESAMDVDPETYQELESSVFSPLFSSLQQGDLESIKKFLKADLYEQYRVLFEQNKDYGQFLRDYYAGTSIQLEKIIRAEEGYVGKAVIYWPDGRSAAISLEVAGSSEGHKVR
jgi:hypothetical protein